MTKNLVEMAREELEKQRREWSLSMLESHLSFMPSMVKQMEGGKTGILTYRGHGRYEIIIRTDRRKGGHVVETFDLSVGERDDNVGGPIESRAAIARFNQILS